MIEPVTIKNENEQPVAGSDGVVSNEAASKESAYSKRGALLTASANPFSTRCVRPGAIPYHFSANQTAEDLLSKLAECGGWGQIVGPHGTGKSTLLQTFIPLLRSRGWDVQYFELHATERKLADFDVRKMGWGVGTQVIVDGYEQLNWWSRGRLVRTCRKCGAGLLVTTHRDLGLPLLLRTEGSLSVTQRIVSELLRETPVKIQEAEVTSAFERHQANVRETLFALYDLYEKRRNYAGGSINTASR